MHRQLCDRNDSQYEIIARFVFDEYGNCIPYLTIALSGQNEYNFTDISVSYHPDDGEGEYMPLSGTFMKLDIDSDESFVQIDPDDSDRMYVNIMLEDSDGSVYQAFACMRPVGDDYYDNDEDSGNSGETAGVIDDMSKGYGKSNAYATGTATLELCARYMRNVSESERRSPKSSPMRLSAAFSEATVFRGTTPIQPGARRSIATNGQMLTANSFISALSLTAIPNSLIPAHTATM